MKTLIFFFIFIHTLIADTIPVLKTQQPHLNLAQIKSWFAVPKTNKLRALMFFVDFENLKGVNNPKPASEISKKLLGRREDGSLEIVDYYQDQSYGQLNFQVHVDHSWLRLSKAKSGTYPEPFRPKNYIRDSLLLAQEKGHNMKDYDIVYIVAPKGMRHNSPTHYMSPKELEGVRHPPKVVVTFGDDGQQSRIQHTVHETGHGMGLPDLYLYDRNRKTKDLTLPGPWAVMGDNWRAKYFTAWSRHLFNWLKDERKIYMEKGERIIELAPIYHQEGVAMIVIPSDKFPKEVFVIEVPKTWKESVKPGVLIYKVNGDVGSGKGCMNVMLAPMAVNEYHNNALWKVGQRFKDDTSKLSVEILEMVKEGYKVKVKLE